MTRLDDEMYRLNLRLDFLRGFAKMKLETYLIMVSMFIDFGNTR